MAGQVGVRATETEAETGELVEVLVEAELFGGSGIAAELTDCGVFTARKGQILHSKGLRSCGSVQPRAGSRKGQGASSAGSSVR